MKIGDLFIKLGLQKGEFDKGIDDAKRKTSAFGSAMGKIGGMIAGVFAVGAITGFVSNIIKTRSEFEKYEAVLANSLGSHQAARQEMKMLQEVAAKTPFSLSELTGAYVKLVNYGLKPTKEEIIKLGDLASSTGKGFNQLTEAVADAVTGQYERLKEFGIKASLSGDKVTFTFKEQKTAVDNNAASIKAYLISLGDLKGVSGSMAAISETLGGRISNLGDAWDSLLNTLGKGTSGIMTTVINWLSGFISLLDMAYRSIEDIKRSVMDQSTIDSMTKGLEEIAVIERSLLKNGVSGAEAHKRAIDLYVSSINNSIKEINPYKHGGTEQINALNAEREAVLSHFRELDKAKINAAKVDTKTAAEQLAALKKVNDELEAQRILRQEFKGEKMTEAPVRYKEAGDFQLGVSSMDAFGGGVFGNLDSHYADITAKRKKWTEEELQGWTEFTDQLNQTIASGIGDVITTMASGFGEMMGTGDWDWGDFGLSILDSVGKFMQTLGGLLIAFGIAHSKWFIALTTAATNPLSGGLAIAAGIGLVAAGAAVSSFASKGMSGGGASSVAASGYSNYSASNASAALSGNVVFELEGTKLRGALNNTDRRNTLIR